MIDSPQDPKRRSPQVRLDPLRKFVPNPPIKLDDEYAALFKESHPRMTDGGASV